MESSDKHTRLLYKGIRNILRCDEAEVVHGIARYVVSQHGALRFLSALIERTRSTPIPAIIALVGGLKSFLEVHTGDGLDGAVWIARLGNERRAMERLPRLLPEMNWNELRFRLRPKASNLLALTRKFVPALPRLFRVARLLHRRYEFFKVLRVVELISYYMRYLEIFRHARFRLALMSSHSNPHGIAFNLAAREYGVAVVLISHGMPVRPVARLHYDLAVVHCEAARQTYMEEGCHMGQVLTHGRRQHHASMPEGKFSGRLSVGIFLCKDVNEHRLRALVERLLSDSRVSLILVRPHPKNLWVGLDDWIASLKNPRVRRSPCNSVFRDIEESDIVLAGNSSVLVDAVTAGRPAAYVHGLDYASDDMHEFVARGLIYRMDESGFDPDAMLLFYRRPEWPGILRLFANVDEDEAAVADKAVAIMRELVMPREGDTGNLERDVQVNSEFKSLEFKL